MYSPSSSSSDCSSSSWSDDSVDRRRGSRSRHGSKSSRRGHSARFDEDVARHSKDAKSLSPLLRKYSSELSPERRSSSHRKKSKGRDASVSRKELSRIQRRHEKEFRNLLQFLEQESSLLNGLEEEKREELRRIERRHEKEVRKLFQFQEKEVNLMVEEHERRVAELEETLERTVQEADEEARRRDDRVQRLEGNLKLATAEVKATMQTSMGEMQTLQDALTAAELRKASMEDEVRVLKETLREKDAQIRRLERRTSKPEDALREELKRQERASFRKSPVLPSSHAKLGGIPISENEWEETSDLTSDFELPAAMRKSADIYRPKPSLIAGRRTSNSSSILRDHRDDADTKRLAVSFSDSVERRMVPMQRQDSLSRRLERMYLPRR